MCSISGFVGMIEDASSLDEAKKYAEHAKQGIDHLSEHMRQSHEEMLGDD